MLIENGILKAYDGDMKNVVIPEEVKTIAGDVEQKDIKNKKLTDDGVFYNAFTADSQIETVTMPDSVLKVGPKAFEHCKNLKNIHFSKNLQVISMSAFLGCENLREITIPASVKEIQQWSLDLIDFNEIKYEGTVEEYKKISVSNEALKKTFTVTCSNGKVLSNGSNI